MAKSAWRDNMGRRRPAVVRESVQYHEGAEAAERVNTVTLCLRKSLSSQRWCSARWKGITVLITY
jgi:hypothetical protein